MGCEVAALLKAACWVGAPHTRVHAGRTFYDNVTMTICESKSGAHKLAIGCNSHQLSTSFVSAGRLRPLDDSPSRPVRRSECHQRYASATAAAAAPSSGRSFAASDSFTGSAGAGDALADSDSASAVASAASTSFASPPSSSSASSSAASCTASRFSALDSFAPKCAGLVRSGLRSGSSTAGPPLRSSSSIASSASSTRPSQSRHLFAVSSSRGSSSPRANR
mmetsp:Transcript_15337/g.53279  ORF Transcript_15337/g.53279 Transcript_15337/m.53279 type:complete len:222 (-) Transcript_15337:1264-1929(-)